MGQRDRGFMGAVSLMQASPSYALWGDVKDPDMSHPSYWGILDSVPSWDLGTVPLSGSSLSP